ncbi:MAG TPA: hypothetical protein VJV21_01445 [Pyrinomonadaceae bacterium]|nr:hypothetical protein [Pyrinomonadaceae bacterium]
MKFINRATTLAVVLTLSAVSAWAQAKECTDDFKTATYSKWYDNRVEKQDVAYEAAKEYLSVCTTEDQYSAALKKFVAAYDKNSSGQKLAQDFDNAVKSKNYADQIRFGKQLVATPAHADNAVIYLLMAGAGLGDPNLMSESAQAAKKAIELLEAGKTFDKSGYTTKDQALAAMTYLVAKSTMKTSPADAIPYFIKAAKYQSDLQKSPVIYNELGTAYGEGPLDKLAKEYKTLADAGKTVDSPEIKLVVANINQVLDRQIDAYARAAAVSTAPADKKAFTDLVAAVYKDRNKKDPAENELNTMVASALSRPLPDPPTPITTLPTPAGPAPAGTGAAPTGGVPSSAGAGTNGAGSAASSTKPSPAGTAAPTTAPAKPAATPKPKPRRANHRRG